MKAAVVPTIGGTWRLEDVPAPKPEPNQVLIQIRASGLCYTDVHMTNGALPGELGKVKVMAETYLLDEIGKAYERVAAGKVRFRAVMTT